MNILWAAKGPERQPSGDDLPPRIVLLERLDLRDRRMANCNGRIGVAFQVYGVSF